VKLLFENWRKYLKEQEEQKVVTFDFDDTIALSHWSEEEENWVHDGPNPTMISRLKKFIADPSVTVYIVTSRFEEQEPQSLENPNQKAVQEFLDENGLNIDGLYFTDGIPKIETLLQLGSVTHHDDFPGDILDARANDIETVVSDPYGEYEKLEASELQQREQQPEELEEVGMPPMISLNMQPNGKKEAEEDET